jgi:hypothetical protein
MARFGGAAGSQRAAAVDISVARSVPLARSGEQKRKAFKLGPLYPTETEVHEAVVQLLEIALMPGVEWTCFPAGHLKLSPDQAAKLARMGLRRGWPDFQILHAGTFHGIELKKRGGKLSVGRFVRTRRGATRWIEGQAEVLPRLATAGAKIAICETLQEVIDALRLWRIPVRGGIL